MEKLNYENRDKLKEDVRDFLETVFALKDDDVINLGLHMVPPTDDPEIFIRRLYWTWMFLTDADALTNVFSGSNYREEKE